MKCYVYHEGEAAEGANDVCSFLKDYIYHDIDENKKKLHLFCDNCCGQNKNNTLIRMLMSLVELKKFDEIQVYYPMRGHSFMPCDRDFSLIKRVLNKTERFYTLAQYIDIIKEASKNPTKFAVVQVTRDLIYDFKIWWSQSYKKTCLSNDSYGKNVSRDNKVTFALASYHHLKISGTGHELVCSSFINSFAHHTFRLRNTMRNVTHPTNKAYAEKLPISMKKMDDIKQTLKFIPDEFAAFWQEISTWPIQDHPNDDM